ncbi:unnamed protein product [Phytophthora lilii]|uniref:Unnamed protein product n=1 Tax=Phytophthora lilii TaxID=2077276 RepID=A0A9W6TJE8_9STRA|nr:unnamed protein product [Phytophthora lilii]
MESQPRRLSDGSLPRDDSFVESQQCSADPSAFLGFHVPPSAEEPPLRAPRSTLKLVLDLEAGTDGVRPLQSPANPFSDLFAGDTQDDENVEAQAAEAEELQPVKRRRRSEEGKRSPSPPPTMLKDMENAWREKKQKDAITEKEERELRDSIPGTSALSECSEDLAPRVFEKVFTPMAEEAKDNGKENEVAADKDPSKSMEDSDRETDFEDELECTQPLDDNDDVDMDGDVTRSYAFSASDEHEEETEVYPYSDTGTQPYGPDSTFMEDDDNDSTSNVRKETEDSYSSSKPSRPTPETVRHSGQRSTEDDFTSREASQSTQQDYLTPRVNPIRVDQPGSNETPTKFVVVNAPNDKTELNSKKSQDEDEQEECVPTQPSKSGIEEEPAAEPSSLQSISKENSAIGASKQNTVADSQTKAIRTLEFSFSMPESQEGEPHFSASLSGDAAKPSESFYRSEKPSPFETSISPVWPPTPTPTPTPVDNPAVPEVTVSTAQKQVSSKRKPVSPSQSDSPTEHKKQRTSPESTESPSHITATPNTKSRKRGFFSPQQSVSSRASEGCDQLTPRPPVRRGTRSAQSTPSSTPTVRTRTKILTPVPVHRAYASRSRTLFKYKFEFCLTGFVKSGEESLKELIEGHGGKIPERYQDVLYKNNPKAVVIATPVSWRKRKFMQAIACGIPVVHTDWIKDCIEAGYVIPFDGYQVPAGYSVTTRKFECFTPREVSTTAI